MRNSRWNDGGGGGEGGGGGRGGGVNAKGFHGHMREDARLEKQLFNTDEHASQGINFDRVGFLEDVELRSFVFSHEVFL